MKKENNPQLMEKIISLCKRRGFVFPGSEIYGGLANSFDYGPLGVELKNNIKNLWWKRFVQQRDDMVGIDAALIMNPKVWEASGHLENFSDPLVECQICHERFRCDDPFSEETTKEMAKHIFKKHPDRIGRGTEYKWEEHYAKPKQFNLMLKTFLGPVENNDSIVYFRPEIAQSMFVDFKNVLDTTRRKLPFGIASQGKAFRNEITPGNFIFRTREFNLMELEYFISENEWEKWFEYWKEEMKNWLKELGVNLKHVHEIEIPEGERAHYSKRTIDFEYDYPFGRKELYGLAYRNDFDLKRHFKEPPYEDAESGEKFYPHVIEPTFGLDRSILVSLLEAYHEEEGRIVLKLPVKLAPYKVAVFPLLKNKPELVEKAREVYGALRKQFTVAFDDRGNIGKRYYSQDEIGTPFCITVDFDTLKNDDVTVRDRDTMKQERIKIKDLQTYINGKLI